MLSDVFVYDVKVLFNCIFGSCLNGTVGTVLPR